MRLYLLKGNELINYLDALDPDYNAVPMPTFSEEQKLSSIYDSINGINEWRRNEIIGELNRYIPLDDVFFDVKWLRYGINDMFREFSLYQKIRSYFVNRRLKREINHWFDAFDRASGKNGRKIRAGVLESVADRLLLIDSKKDEQKLEDYAFRTYLICVELSPDFTRAIRKVRMLGDRFK